MSISTACLSPSRAQPRRQLAHLAVDLLQQQAAEPPLRQQAGELQPVATGLALPFGQMGIQQQRLELIVLQAVQLEGLAVFDGRLLQLEPYLEASVEEVPGGLAIEAQQLRQLSPCSRPTPQAGADRRSGSWRPRSGSGPAASRRHG